MRFGWLMAAMAALWVQPAAALQIVLTSPLSSQGVHQKITLADLQPGDFVNVFGGAGGTNGYWWDFSGGKWNVDGNGLGDFGCQTGAPGQCHSDYSFASGPYPISQFGSIDLKVVENTVFVDWTLSDNVMLCFGIPESERIVGVSNKCGYTWSKPNSVSLDLRINGEMANDVRYTVSAYDPNPTPTPVPEPASWALMIMGIGMAGFAMRRRSILAKSPAGLCFPNAGTNIAAAMLN